MGRIAHELKSIPGMVLATTVTLIITFFIINLIARKGPGPLGQAGAWVFGHATGDAYSQPGAPLL
jgi:hypothetical protein